jgi:hypothetical protein
MSKLIVNEIEKYDAGQLTITTGTNVSIGSNLTVGGTIAGSFSVSDITTAINSISATQLSDITSVGSGSIITTTERNKLSGIEDLADVTDATNVAAAGALMDGVAELADLADVASTAPSDGQVLTYDTVNGWQPETPSGGGTIDGSGTADYIAKWSDSDTLTDSLIEDDGTTVSVGGNLNVDSNTLYVDATNNRVGVGISNPDSIFTIARGATSDYSLKFHRGNRTNQGIYTDGSGITLQGVDATNGYTAIRILGDIVDSNDYDYIRFDTHNAERMRITSGGQLLVNTTSSLYSLVRLSVKQTTGDRTMEVWSAWSGDQGTEALNITKYDNVSTTNQVFQRFVINNGSTNSGQINANGASQAAFGSYSDIRLKENIEDLPNQLNKINSLRPVEFDYLDGSGHQIGFIAQEMQEVYPDAVGEGENGMLSITGWSKTEARLVKAIQEQQDMINELRAEVESLKSQING